MFDPKKDKLPPLLWLPCLGLAWAVAPSSPTTSSCSSKSLSRHPWWKLFWKFQVRQGHQTEVWKSEIKIDLFNLEAAGTQDILWDNVESSFMIPPDLALNLIISDSGFLLANTLKTFKHTLVMWKYCASHSTSRLNWVMQLYHTTCSWLLFPSYGLNNVKYPWNQATFMLRLFDPERTNAFYTQPSEINPWNGICANLTPTTGGYATIFYDYSVTNS